MKVDTNKQVMRRIVEFMNTASEKHWHGATPTAAMTHIALQEKLNSKVVEWMEQVSDEQYRAGKYRRLG